MLISATMFATFNKIPSRSLKNDINELSSICNTFSHIKFTQYMTVHFDFCFTFITQTFSKLPALDEPT